MCLEESGCVWRKVGVPGGKWVCLEENGCVWRKVGMPGGTWVCLEESGCVWRKVGVSGGKWVCLEEILRGFTVERSNDCFRVVVCKESTECEVR